MIEQTITDAQFDDIITQLWATDSDSARSHTVRQNRSLVLKQLLREPRINQAIRGTPVGVLSGRHGVPGSLRTHPDGER